MLPQPAAGGEPFQAGPAAQRLGRIADQDVVTMGARFEREGHRGAAGLGNVHEDVAAAGRDDHGASLS